MRRARVETAIQKKLCRLPEALGVAPLVHTRARFLIRIATRATRRCRRRSRKKVLDLFLDAAGRIETALRLRPGTSAKVEIIESDILAVNPQPLADAWDWSRLRRHIQTPTSIGYITNTGCGGSATTRCGFATARLGSACAFLRRWCESHRFPAPDGRCISSARQDLHERRDDLFVVGDSKIHGQIVNNADELKEAAAMAGFSAEGHVRPKHARAKKSFNLAHARIRQEHILVFKRKRRLHEEWSAHAAPARLHVLSLRARLGAAGSGRVGRREFTEGERCFHVAGTSSDANLWRITISRATRTARGRRTLQRTLEQYTMP